MLLFRISFMILMDNVHERPSIFNLYEDNLSFHPIPLHSSKQHSTTTILPLNLLANRDVIRHSAYKQVKVSTTIHFLPLHFRKTHLQGTSSRSWDHAPPQWPTVKSRHYPLGPSQPQIPTLRLQRCLLSLCEYAIRLLEGGLHKDSDDGR